MNLALTTTVTRKIPTVVVKEIIENSDNLIFINDYDGVNDKPHVFLNGILMGITLDPEAFITEMKAYRENGLLDKEVSFSFNDDDIRIFCDEGRFIRPLLTVNDATNRLNITEKDDLSDWDKLVEKQFIQYVDNSEIQSSVIAMDEKDLLDHKNDFFEICPAMMLGVMASAIPYCDHNQCISSIEHVLLSNGTTKQIKDVKVGDEVITFNPETQKQSYTKVTYTITWKTDKDVFKVTTINGRNLTATYDHPFMTDKGWTNVENLDVDNSLVAISLEPKPVSTIVDEYVILDENTFKMKCLKAGIKENCVNKYVNELNHILPLKSNSVYINVISRMFGFLLTDSWIGINEYIRLGADFGNEYSAELFEQDVEFLGFKKVNITFSDSKPDFGCTYKVEHSGSLPSLFVALGINAGKKTTQPACEIPFWIMNGSDMVKREFLSGFQGGDGSKIKKGQEKQIHVQMAKTTKSIEPKYLDSLIKMMSDIVTLFRELSIDVQDVEYEKSTKYENRMLVSYYINNSRTNLIKYFDTINYRYDIYKQVESGILVEYMRYLEFEYDKRKNLVDAVKSYGNMKRSLIAEKLNITTKQVLNILTLKFDNIGLPKGLLTAKEWEKKVKVKASTIFLPILSIEKTDDNIVSDITVENEENQSFLCGDMFCVHNSPRNIYQSSMGKQALGFYASSHQIRSDTITYVLDYPQRPLISTIPAQMMGFNDMPSGINAIVAIACYTGFKTWLNLLCVKS